MIYLPKYLGDILPKVNQLVIPKLPPMRLFNRASFQTPESVELDFILAGIGSRAYALVIDYIIWSLILLFFSIIWAFVSIQISEILTNLIGKDNVSLWMISIWILVYFAIYMGYFVFFETVWQGQTPGKKFTKIRVICDDGRPAGLAQATLRALLRPIDDIFFIGLLLIAFSKQEKRLGDIVAGTLVIQEERPLQNNYINFSENAQTWADYLRKNSDLSQLLPEDFAVIREYLQRREGMLKEAKKDLSLKLASEIKTIIALEKVPEGVTANMFLEAVYLAYQHKEHKNY